MDLRSTTTVIWRIVGSGFVIYGSITAFVQFGAVSGTFGQIMDDESLYNSTTLLAIFLWPMLSGLAGIVIVLSSRMLAGLVIRGLVTNDR